MSKVICDLPIQLSIPNLFSVMTYMMTGQYHEDEWRLYYFEMICILIALSANSQGLMISAFFMKEPTAAVLFGSFTATPMTLFSGIIRKRSKLLLFFHLIECSFLGILTRIDKIPFYFRWYTYTNYFKYGLEASMAIIYGFDRCKESKFQDKYDFFRPIFANNTNHFNNELFDKFENLNITSLQLVLKQVSGQTSNNNKSMALINYGLSDDHLWNGILMLMIIMTVNSVLTYILLLVKVRTHN
jgi:hypothetical protein